jgi:hypothetical protein
MSITVGHRAIFDLFRHRAVRSVGFPAIKTVGGKPMKQGELRCSPWEGLYLEQACLAQPLDEETRTREQLDAFLAGLTPCD